MKSCLLFWAGFHELHLRASHPYLWTCCGVTSNHPVWVGFAEWLGWAESHGPGGAFEEVLVSPSKRLAILLVACPSIWSPIPQISVSPPQGPGGALGTRAAGELSPCHSTSQPVHPPADVLRKGLAAWAASPTPLGHWRVPVAQAGTGKVPLDLTGDGLQLPSRLLANTLSLVLSYLPPSLSFSSSLPFSSLCVLVI